MAGGHMHFGDYLLGALSILSW